MSGVAKQAAVKAIHATEQFLPKGTLTATTAQGFNLLKEIAVGTVLGISAGLVWKTYHWNEKRRVAEFYSALSEREEADEAAYTADLRSKLKELEDELLA